MTNRELTNLIKRTRGSLFVPVNSHHDSYFIRAVKTDVVEILDCGEPNETAPWEPLETTNDTGIYLHATVA